MKGCGYKVRWVVMLGVVVVLVMGSGGCWNPFKREPIEGSKRANALTQGYSLLSGVVGQETRVGMVTWVRSYDREIGVVLFEIQMESKNLEGWLSDVSQGLRDNGVRMNRNGLPEVERWARKWIEERTKKEILGGEIKRSELVMILGQAKATEYVAALCAGLANIEVNDGRRNVLKGYVVKFEKLNEKCLVLLEKRRAARSGAGER